MKKFHVLLSLILALTMMIAPASAGSLDSLLGGGQPDMPLPDMAQTMQVEPYEKDMGISLIIGGGLWTGKASIYEYEDEQAAFAVCQAFHSAMTDLGYEASSVSDDVYEALLYRQGNAWALMVRELGLLNHVCIMTQDGSYAEVSVPAPPCSAADLTAAIEDFYVHGQDEQLRAQREELGDTAFLMGESVGVRGNGIRYTMPEGAEERMMNALSDFMETTARTWMQDKGISLSFEDESINGYYFLMIHVKQKPLGVLVFTEDFKTVFYIPNGDDTATESESASQRNSFSQLLADALAAKATAAPTAALTAPPTAAPAVQGETSFHQSGTYNGESKSILAALYDLPDSSTMGPGCACVALVCMPTDSEAHVIYFIMPEGAVASGSRLTLDQFVSGQAQYALMLEVQGAQPAAYIAKDAPGLFQSAEITLGNVSGLNSAEYTAAVSYTLNGRTHTVTSAGVANWDELMPLESTQTTASQGDGVCGICEGSGLCTVCNGAGKTYTYISSLGWLDCSPCYGKGTCRWCQGTGYGGLYAR